MKLPRVAGWGLGFSMLLVCIGCGSDYRAVANPTSQATGTPSSEKIALVVYQAEDPYNSYQCVDGATAPCIGATSQIDSTGATDVADVYVGNTPIAGAVNSGGSEIAVSNNSSNSVSVFATNSSSATRTNIGLTGTSPTAVTSASSNGYFYVANTGSISGQVSVLAPTTTPPGTVKTVSVGATPVALAASPDSTKVYVVNQADNTVSVISTTGNTVNSTPPITVGTTPTSIVANSTKNVMYVLNSGSSNISIIDVSTDAATTLSLPSASTSASYMAFNSSQQLLYVATPGSTPTLSIFNTATTPPTALTSPTLSGVTFPTAGSTALQNPPVIAPLASGSSVYVVSTSDCSGASGGLGSVWTLSTATNTLSGCTAVGRAPVAIATSGDNKLIYVPHQGSSSRTTDNNPITSTCTNRLTTTTTAIWQANCPGTTVINVSTGAIHEVLPPVTYANRYCTAPDGTICYPMFPVFVTSQ